MSVPHQVEDIQRFLMHPLRKDKMHLVHLPPGSAFLGIPVFPCQVLPLAQHLLLRVSGKFATSEEFYAQLERSIRSSDIAGLGTDENVYLLLNQATEENLPLLTQRMAEKGFQVTSVSLDGQHRLIAAAKKDPVNEC